MVAAMPRDTPSLPGRHQRADGAFDLVFGTAPRGTVLRDLYQQSPLRILFPTPEPGEPPTAALLDLGKLPGGSTGGAAYTPSRNRQTHMYAVLEKANARSMALKRVFLRCAVP